MAVLSPAGCAVTVLFTHTSQGGRWEEAGEALGVGEQGVVL